MHYYVADFYCHECKLVIEIDGVIHCLPENKERDEGRTGELERLDIRVIRFTNDEVLNDCETVLNKIKEIIEEIRKSKQRKILFQNEI